MAQDRIGEEAVSLQDGEEDLAPGLVGPDLFEVTKKRLSRKVSLNTKVNRPMPCVAFRAMITVPWAEPSLRHSVPPLVCVPK